MERVYSLVEFPLANRDDDTRTPGVLRHPTLGLLHFLDLARCTGKEAFEIGVLLVKWNDMGS